MKILILVLVAASLSLGFAAADGTNSWPEPASVQFPAGCIVAIPAAPGYLPRAGLVVENRGSEPLRVRLEGRAGLSLNQADLGVVGAGASVTFAHTLPAGRNVLRVRGDSGREIRQVFYVNNHGARTCGRRYAWPIQ
jgi:hypothetical protein